MGDRTLARDELGQFAPLYDAAFRGRVRLDYETSDLLLREITEKYQISATTIQDWVHAEGWVMRQPHHGVDPNNLVSRMLGLLDKQIAELEIVMKNGATEVAMLSKLVRTLDRVLALKERSAKADTRPSMRVVTLRTKIAERLAELNRA